MVQHERCLFVFESGGFHYVCVVNGYTSKGGEDKEKRDSEIRIRTS